MKIIVVQTTQSPDLVQNKLNIKFPELKEFLFCTNSFELTLKEIRPNQKSFVITGNFLKTETRGLQRNADALLKEIKKINQGAKVILYSSDPFASNPSGFDAIYKKEGAGDYECNGYIEIFYKEGIVKTPEIPKISWYQSFLSRVLGQ